MNLILNRLQASELGTNGEITVEGKHVCYTIERPWLDNQRRISCIPTGRYQLKPRFSQKFKYHLILLDVPGRDLILIHPANDAIKELNGCIAPVSDHTGIGKGVKSVVAFVRVMAIVNFAFQKNEDVFLQVT
ncbi:DUF5675 family protein [Runella zeae]|uniref:DUF5675 family protein n=1 Tax=Runella zeae TaxID=94255 RepID=UPI000490D897|nr:DUF5675 family protein [Runella zeae]